MKKVDKLVKKWMSYGLITEDTKNKENISVAFEVIFKHFNNNLIKSTKHNDIEIQIFPVLARTLEKSQTMSIKEVEKLAIFILNDYKQHHKTFNAFKNQFMGINNIDIESEFIAQYCDNFKN